VRANSKENQTFMFKAFCPSCGANVVFKSPASVMAVCEYCQTTVLKDADSVKDIGKMASILEDYSPLQIGTTGIYQQQGFSLLGRIQLKYDDGLWNEWYALFDDGKEGWLSEASGQYTFNFLDGKADDAPPFEQLRPLSKYRLYSATDVRTARCTGGQGELPFKVGKGWQTQVADFRIKDNFLTLDYSDGFPPLRYVGKAVNLDDLQCQLLRDKDVIEDSAGRIKGQMQALDCPSCGSQIAYASQAFKHIVCPACSANVELNEDKAIVIEKHRQVAALATSLSLGDVGNIDNVEYTLIGLLQAEELGEDAGAPWVEYLLYNATAGFLWLVESSDGWDKVSVLNEMPDNTHRDSLSYQQKIWKKLWTYRAKVTYAAGAFNWRVKVGDITEITDYQANQQKISAEKTTQEVTWSLAQKVPSTMIAKWFNKTLPQPLVNSYSGNKLLVFKIFAVLLWLINLPLIIFGSGSFVLTIIATAVLWFLAVGT
jgi:ribosomal protein S27E